jgi:hypothetical protein
LSALKWGSMSFEAADGMDISSRGMFLGDC